jgi:hypothetical protein
VELQREPRAESARSGVHCAGGAATQAGPTLAELQNRIADRLDIASIRLVISQARIRQRRTGLIVNFGFATLVDIGALVYALSL